MIRYQYIDKSSCIACGSEKYPLLKIANDVFMCRSCVKLSQRVFDEIEAERIAETIRMSAFRELWGGEI